jgi:hypothetical protein
MIEVGGEAFVERPVASKEEKDIGGFGSDRSGKYDSLRREPRIENPQVAPRGDRKPGSGTLCVLIRIRDFRRENRIQDDSATDGGIAKENDPDRTLLEEEGLEGLHFPENGLMQTDRQAAEERFEFFVEREDGHRDVREG